MTQADASDGGASEPAPDAGLWTVANLISLGRLALVPVFLWLLLTDHIAWAIGVFWFIGWTDFFDGWFARKLGQVSEIGKLLDPIADRVAIFAAVVGGMIAGIVPLWLSVSLIIREALVAVGALYLVSRGVRGLEVRYLGKVATFLVYGAIPSYYLAAIDVAPTFFETLGLISGGIGIVLYYYVSILYFKDARTQLAASER